MIAQKITLTIPNDEQLHQHFSLRLKQHIANESAIYESADRILALSDIEGNFMRLLNLLFINKVIDKKLSWIFGEGHLVIVGDCFDRGEQVIECLWLIYSLEEKANKEGGHVHFILGNHEIMNMNGDWRYVHPRYSRTRKTPYTALYSGNNEIWKWLRSKNIIEKIGPYLFVHGGISKEFLQLAIPLDEINDRIRPFYTHGGESFSDPLLNAVFNSDKSPFWYRGYYQADMDQKLVNEVAAFYQVSTIITGHTMMNEIKCFYGGKIINIDTDHSSEVSEALLINKNRFYRILSNGKKEKIK